MAEQTSLLRWSVYSAVTKSNFLPKQLLAKTRARPPPAQVEVMQVSGAGLVDGHVVWPLPGAGQIPAGGGGGGGVGGGLDGGCGGGLGGGGCGGGYGGGVGGGGRGGGGSGGELGGGDAVPQGVPPTVGQVTV